jgi:hypothetical protein
MPPGDRSGATDTDWIQRLNDLSTINDLDSALTRLLFLPIAAFFVQAANAVEAVSNVLIAPLDSFATGVASIVSELLGGSAGIIESGAGTSASDVSVFGIISFPVAVGLTFITAILVANYLQQEETSNFLPFTFTDIPFVGIQEEED